MSRNLAKSLHLNIPMLLGTQAAVADQKHLPFGLAQSFLEAPIFYLPLHRYCNIYAVTGSCFFYVVWLFVHFGLYYCVGLVALLQNLVEGRLVRFCKCATKCIGYTCLVKRSCIITFLAVSGFFFGTISTLSINLITFLIIVLLTF